MIQILLLLFAGHLLSGADTYSSHSPIPPLTLEISAPLPASQKQVEITAEAALVLDIKAGAPLYEKNIHEKRAVASLTKLMTALVLLEEEENLFKSTSTSYKAYTTIGSQMHLLQGEEIQLIHLLSALLISSANDAAVAIAEHVSESVPGFVEKMNQKARALGLKNTQFQNPHGLDAEEAYSTAFEMTLIAKKVIEYNTVREIVQKKEDTVKNVSGTISHPLRSTNWLLNSPFPVYGLKTGTTENAGECFIALVKVKNKEVLITVLGSTDRFQDTKALLWLVEQD